jgi:hypothetical protein
VLSYTSVLYVYICGYLNQEPEGGLEAGETYAILPRQSSEELRQLPSLLTSKVLELREGLNYLCTASGTS